MGRRRCDVVHVCSFDSTMDIKGKRLTYATIKAAVLEAGRFSVFEATHTRLRAKLFDQLCKDPEMETFQMGFPWTGIRRKAHPPSTP